MFTFSCFYVVLLYHLFRFSVFYKSGIGGRLSSDGAQERYTLGMVTPRSLLLFCQTNDVAYLSSDSTDSTFPCFNVQTSLKDESINRSQHIRL